jgi:hypothetical protein
MAMAKADSTRIRTLLETVTTSDQAVESLLEATAREHLREIVHFAELNLAEASLERADELRKKWFTEGGQLWRIERRRVVCGDSTDSATVDRLFGYEDPSARMIRTDAPSGVGYGEKVGFNVPHHHGRRSFG